MKGEIIYRRGRRRKRKHIPENHCDCPELLLLRCARGDKQRSRKEKKEMLSDDREWVWKEGQRIK